MPEQKFCPFKTAGWLANPNEIDRSVSRCDPKNCALGNPDATGCVLRDCAGTLTGLFLLLMGKETVIPPKPKGPPDEQKQP